MDIYLCYEVKYRLIKQLLGQEIRVDNVSTNTFDWVDPLSGLNTKGFNFVNKHVTVEYAGD